MGKNNKVWPRLVNPGDKFGRWTVVDYAEPVCGHRSLLCKCECGNTSVVTQNRLRCGVSLSCGCYNKDKMSTHNMSSTRVYKSWDSIKQRCLNPNHKSYVNYGGRGITICDRWLNSFDNFYEDMGDPPSSRHTIDRIDTDDNYHPKNCRWATPVQQANNRRNTIYLSVGGRVKPMKEWANDDRCTVSYTTLAKRVQMGWDDESAVLSPLNHYRARSTAEYRRAFT